MKLTYRERWLLSPPLVSWIWHAEAFYNPTFGRWFCRDPIQEKGGLNVCMYVDSR